MLKTIKFKDCANKTILYPVNFVGYEGISTLSNNRKFKILKELTYECDDNCSFKVKYNITIGNFNQDLPICCKEMQTIIKSISDKDESKVKKDLPKIKLINI